MDNKLKHHWKPPISYEAHKGCAQLSDFKSEKKEIEILGQKMDKFGDVEIEGISFCRNLNKLHGHFFYVVFRKNHEWINQEWIAKIYYENDGYGISFEEGVTETEETIIKQFADCLNDKKIIGMI